MTNAACGSFYPEMMLTSPPTTATNLGWSRPIITTQEISPQSNVTPLMNIPGYLYAHSQVFNTQYIDNRLPVNY